MSDDKPIPPTDPETGKKRSAREMMELRKAAAESAAAPAEHGVAGGAPEKPGAGVPPAEHAAPPSKPAAKVPAFPPFPPEPEAVLSPEQEAEAAAFRERLGDAVLGAGLSGRYLRLGISPSAIVEAAALAAARGYNYLSDVVATDLIGSELIRVAYILTNIPDMRRNLVLQVHVPRSAPTVPTVTGVFKGAEWPEREAYDLVGVVFEGHPDLRRIMLPDEWEGHPLRKDYTFID